MQKLLVVLAAAALVGFSVQAAACELNRQASTEPVVVADATTQTPSTPQDPKALEGDRGSRAAEPTPEQSIKTETPAIR